MAGTPTPNYQFPTYAETDTPNLAGAYNQAVNAIDAKIKEVSDSIPSGADVPDANSTTKGIAKLYDSTTVGAGDQDDGGITPKAVKDYVDAKVPTEQQAYTGTAPIVVDNGSHTISVGNGTNIDYVGGAYTDGVPGVVYSMNSTATLNYFNTGTLPPVNGALMPSLAVTRQWVLSRTPDATASVKGLVRLASAYSTADKTNAATGAIINSAINSVLQSWGSLQAAATKPLTTEMLANLYVTPSGMVVYKAPTE